MMITKPTKGKNFSPNSSSSPSFKDLVGRIIKKEPKKVYQENEFNGNTYFKLTIINEANRKNHIFVYPNIVSQETFAAIADSIHINKWYSFGCERKGNWWILHHWQELPVNSNISKKPILPHHD